MDEELKSTKLLRKGLNLKKKKNSVYSIINTEDSPILLWI